MWETLRAPRASGVFQVGVGNSASPPGERSYPSPLWATSWAGTQSPSTGRPWGASPTSSPQRAFLTTLNGWCGRDAHTPGACSRWAVRAGRPHSGGGPSPPYELRKEKRNRRRRRSWGCGKPCEPPGRAGFSKSVWVTLRAPRASGVIQAPCGATSWAGTKSPSTGRPWGASPTSSPQRAFLTTLNGWCGRDAHTPGPCSRWVVRAGRPHSRPVLSVGGAGGTPTLQARAFGGWCGRDAHTPAAGRHALGVIGGADGPGRRGRGFGRGSSGCRRRGARPSFGRRGASSSGTPRRGRPGSSAPRRRRGSETSGDAA